MGCITSTHWLPRERKHICGAQLGYETAYRYLIHDRDSIFSVELDASVGNFGLRVLKIPPRSPMANGICERLIGTIRRECLDWLIPQSEAHLRLVLKSWIGHYN